MRLTIPVLKEFTVQPKKGYQRLSIHQAQTESEEPRTSIYHRIERINHHLFDEYKAELSAYQQELA